MSEDFNAAAQGTTNENLDLPQEQNIRILQASEYFGKEI
jgi:hypothetical protein